MADPLGFLKIPREEPILRSREECLRDYGEPRLPCKPALQERQAGRCMECGEPFCEIDGCPAGNRVQDWMSLVYGGKWRAALDILQSTDNFPEITGRLCTAPCERACILSISFSPVTIREIEREIADRGWREGWIIPEPANTLTGRRVAIIGSGPAGLAAAQQLVRKGHTVTVFDSDDRVGGILRYGIPDFSLDKKVLDRRIGQIVAEGVVFETGVVAGVDLSIAYLKRSFDVVVVFSGSRSALDIDVPGRDLAGICSAMDFLVRQNRINAGDAVADDGELNARDKRVVIVGGGEIASYCAGVSRRQGASSVTVLEPADHARGIRTELNWSKPLETRLSFFSGDPLADDCEHVRGVTVERFLGNRGKLKSVSLLEPGAGDGFDADLVLLALGFEKDCPGPLIRSLFIDSDDRGNLKVDDRFMTSVDGVFAVEDCVPGEIPVARAIATGRHVAGEIDLYLEEHPK